MDEFPKISGFNYRIARHKVGDDAYYRIHECFYDENGRVVLWGVLWGESSPHGETADALIADLEQMLADAKRSRDDTFLMFLRINIRSILVGNRFYSYNALSLQRRRSISV